MRTSKPSSRPILPLQWRRRRRRLLRLVRTSTPSSRPTSTLQWKRRRKPPQVPQRLPPAHGAKSPPPWNAECVVDAPGASPATPLPPTDATDSVAKITARYMRNRLMGNAQATELSRRLWGVWARSFGGHYNIHQGLTSLKGHAWGSEADGRDLLWLWLRMQFKLRLRRLRRRKPPPVPPPLRRRKPSPRKGAGTSSP